MGFIPEMAAGFDRKRKNKNINESDEIKLAYEVSKHLDLDYDKLNDKGLVNMYIVKI